MCMFVIGTNDMIYNRMETSELSLNMNTIRIAVNTTT